MSESGESLLKEEEQKPRSESCITYIVLLFLVLSLAIYLGLVVYALIKTS
jgi:hypothetical protein